MFSLVSRLPSRPSARGFPPLFGHFAGTSRLSDSPPTCMLDFWLKTFSNRPAHNFVSGIDGVSRFSRVEFPCMPGVLMGSPGSRAWSFHACQGSRTAQSPAGTRATVSADIAFRMWELRRHPDFRDFRGSMACLHVPLSTFTSSLATVRP